MVKYTPFTIRELDTKDAMLSAYDLVAQMYKKMSLEEYSSYLDEMIQANNFKMIGAFDDEGKIVGVAGYWLLRMLYCGRYIQISNLVVDEKKRSLGVGKKILDYFVELGKKLNCDKVVLDSYTENKKSHPLYFRENFYIRGFHFMRDLE